MRGCCAREKSPHASVGRWTLKAGRMRIWRRIGQILRYGFKARRREETTYWHDGRERFSVLKKRSWWLSLGWVWFELERYASDDERKATFRVLGPYQHPETTS